MGMLQNATVLMFSTEFKIMETDHQPSVQQVLATLERPAKAQLDEEIMTSLGSESSPITLEQILAKLRSTSSSSRSVYMHELARSIWRLADEGKVIVESGLIRKRH